MIARAARVAVVVLAGGCADVAAPGGPETTGTASSGSGPTSPGAETTAAGPPRMPTPLVDHTAWAVVDAADDPIPDHRPARIDCGVAGAYPEATTYEIDTARCNYLARSQPSLVEVRAGDHLAVAAYHATLAAVDAGQAHFALLLGGAVIWQEFVPIPAAPGVVDATPYQAEIPIDVDVPAGTPVDLHLHNHGYNTWVLLEVELRPAEGS